MKNQKHKTKISTIAFVLMLTITATLITGLPFVNAQEPWWVVKEHYIYVSAAPNPVGVGQNTLVVWWIDTVPPTPLDEGSWSDFNHWHDITVEITKPDGSKQTMGPYTSDPVGGSWFTLTPDQVGDYTFQAIWPGEWKNTTVITGAYPNPMPVGDWWFSGCTSDPATLTVQQEPLTELPPAELPTGYWTRPIDSANREWWPIAGNWLNDGRNNVYTTSPKTAHIVWTKPQTIGGLTGGEFGTIGYYEGSSYERKWGPKAIIQGRLYYSVGRSDQPQTRGTMCVDLRTGEEIMFMNRTTVDMGLIYNYESPNQHGTIAYLVDTGGTTMFYDPFTGEWLYTIEDVPGGSAVVGPSGERLIYQFNYAQRWLAMWNSSGIQALAGAETGTSGWQWRPVGKTVNGTLGYEWNVTIPDLPGEQTGRTAPTMFAVVEDRILGTTGLASFQYGTEAYSVWCLSLKPGEEGKLMWIQEYPEAPIPGGTVNMRSGRQTVDLESKVFTMEVKESRQIYVYDLDTGNLLWNTESFGPWAMYGMGTMVRDGILYVNTNYDGKVFAFNARTGTKLWEWADDTCGLEGPYERWPLGRSVLVADGKAYLTTGEHSHTQPLYRDWSMYCVDVNTGAGLWNITGVWGSPIIADGYLVSLNGMDEQIYCFGKGPSATTVTASPKVVAKGTGVIIEGMVTDVSAGAKSVEARFPNGLPAISDVDMTAWMEYVYKQHSLPMEATGVSVTLDAIDPNGNFISIGKVTSDLSGVYSTLWEPEHEGKYTILATFEGSDSYYSSYAETAIGVGPASTPGTPIEPEPTEPEPLITTEIAIIAAVAIAAIIGIVAFWALKKRK